MTKAMYLIKVRESESEESQQFADEDFSDDENRNFSFIELNALKAIKIQNTKRSTLAGTKHDARPE